ncbi:MAG TPA: DCC1-like thiol-disulfide oxidoreductase family protein [Opitutaceae bacterium]
MSTVLPVLLFDGECGLCNRVVRWLLRVDRRGLLHFAPLQSQPAQEYLRSRGLPTRDFDSLVFVSDWNSWEAAPPRLRTNGALSAIVLVGGGWSVLAKISRCIPAPLRDLAYKVIARFRYRLFGPYKPTPLPNPSWASRFLT